MTVYLELDEIEELINMIDHYVDDGYYLQKIKNYFIKLYLLGSEGLHEEVKNTKRTSSGGPGVLDFRGDLDPDVIKGLLYHHKTSDEPAGRYQRTTDRTNYDFR